MTAMGVWSEGRGTNLLDTGAHFYEVYETSDGKYVSIGSIEPQFYAELIRLSGLEGEELREYTGLSGTAFSSMRRKFRRKVDAAYPDGWKL